ncbi:asparaginase [Patescibacteria group bacterium]|nr:asparaginase [Patescibacteria group bacterium]
MERYRKKICLLFCEGAILQKSGGKIEEVKKPGDIKPWLMNFEELSIMADIEPIFVFGGKAANVSVKEWQKLNSEIKKRIKDVDGFVILHGPQTMNYTACALAFSWQNLNKPIILTGSPIIESVGSQKDKNAFAEFKGLGIKANLLNAIQVASSEINQVAILFGSRLISAVQAVQSVPSGLNFFDSFSGNYLGRVDFGISLASQKKSTRQKPHYQGNFDNKVSVLDYHPGVDASLLNNLNKQKVHGLIIRLHHQAVLPDVFTKSIKQLAKENIPVVIYQPGSARKFQSGANIIVVDNMTLSATLVKLMWALGQSKKLSKIKRIMSQNLVGEIRK